MSDQECEHRLVNDRGSIICDYCGKPPPTALIWTSRPESFPLKDPQSPPASEEEQAAARASVADSFRQWLNLQGIGDDQERP